MIHYTARVQTTLTAEQYALLVRVAKEQAKSLSGLVREALEKVYFEEADRQSRRQALQELLALNAPVADWAQMEEEILSCTN
jgi:Arc/MetJ-type ribon-helix-helix transcriptional regulator